MTLLQHHILASLLTAVTTFGLGLLVFLADPRRRLNQIFGLYSLAIAWWSFNEAFAVGAPNEQTARLFATAEWLGVIFIAPSFLHTVFLSTEERGKLARWTLILSYVTSFVFVALHLCFGVVMERVRPVGYTRFFSDLSPIGWLLPVLFLLLVHVGLWKLWRAYRQATGQRQTRLKYLFWGSLVGYVGGSPDWLFNFGLYIPGLSPFGIYTVPMYSIATTYAVLHHKLFDVHLVVRKSLVYSLLITDIGANSTAIS